jgi:hypothetical protein
MIGWLEAERATADSELTAAQNDLSSFNANDQATLDRLTADIQATENARIRISVLIRLEQMRRMQEYRGSYR